MARGSRRSTDMHYTTMTLLLGVSIQAANNHAGASKETFSEAAPKAWARYHERAKNLQGSWSYVVRLLPAKEVRHQIRYELRQRQGCVLVMEQDMSDENKGELKVRNPRYAFILRRSAA